MLPNLAACAVSSQSVRLFAPLPDTAPCPLGCSPDHPSLSSRRSHAAAPWPASSDVRCAPLYDRSAPTEKVRRSPGSLRIFSLRHCAASASAARPAERQARRLRQRVPLDVSQRLPRTPHTRSRRGGQERNGRGKDTTWQLATGSPAGLVRRSRRRCSSAFIGTTTCCLRISELWGRAQLTRPRPWRRRTDAVKVARP
ncbi:hypothetical protein PsYK624_108840 [Phanerochaete sordida]|uniref:Uncharacterized protein n=1 Tax=Phanerochaete sordida TaxID=48140 RepID=A0A9P3GER5_9APHY|nr:hypothetical protein PsYK624_108840 [Phanerochaete sordida]